MRTNKFTEMNWLKKASKRGWIWHFGGCFLIALIFAYVGIEAAGLSELVSVAIGVTVSSIVAVVYDYRQKWTGKGVFSWWDILAGIIGAFAAGIMVLI